MTHDLQRDKDKKTANSSLKTMEGRKYWNFLKVLKAKSLPRIYIQ